MKFIKILALGAFALGSLGLASCGCSTGEEPVPPLRRLPKMNEIFVADEIPVEEEESEVEIPEVDEIPVTHEK